MVYEISKNQLSPPIASIPPMELPPGFQWEKNCVVHKFECNNERLILTIPFVTKQDMLNRLAKYDKGKIDFLGKIAIAAGVCEEGIEVSFKANENGEYSFNRHLKDGSMQPINESYFKGERELIQDGHSDAVKKMGDLNKLEAFKKMIDSINGIFKGKCFTGVSATPISDSDKLLALPKHDVVAPVKKKISPIVVKKLIGMAKNRLYLQIGKEDEGTKRLVDAFFEKHFESMELEKFLFSLIEELKQKNIVPMDFQLSVENKKKFIMYCKYLITQTSN